jgi:hypothetical protein
MEGAGVRYEAIETDLPALGAEHDNRHILSPEPHHREAAAFMFQLPEHGLAGFLYPWVNNAGMAGAAACVFGPGLKVPVKERFEEVPVSPAMDFRAWEVKGMSMRIGAPHRTVDLAFAGEQVEIRCTYDAMHPPYAFGSHRNGCPSYYAQDRTEQHGRIEGELKIGGTRYALNGFMQRDHSWGARVWGLNQHYKWFHATTDTAAVHFFEMQSFGKIVLRGYVAKEGRMAEVVSIDYDYTFDENMHQKTFDVVVRDSAGRNTRISAVVFARFEYDVDPMILLKEGATTVTVDGASGTGWCEFCWNKEYFEFARQHAHRFSPGASLTGGG